MAGGCLLLRETPLYAAAAGRGVWAMQLFVTAGLGAGIYLGVCRVLGVRMMGHEEGNNIRE